MLERTTTIRRGEEGSGAVMLTARSTSFRGLAAVFIMLTRHDIFSLQFSRRLTFCCLQPDQFTVLSLSRAVESLHTGVVHGVEVETVHGANCLFATVNLLQIIAYGYSDRNKGRYKALVTDNNLQTTTTDS
jgi:hypothetical protein